MFNGQAGFDVVTPLVADDGTAVAVNRGWVPLEFDQVPVSRPASEGSDRGGSRPPVGASTNPNQAGPVLTRVDLDLISQQVGLDLAPVYIEIVGDPNPTVLPVVSPPPDFGDEGPHLTYAIQWFAFALVGAIGYGFLLRRAIRRSGDGNGEIGDYLDSREERQIGPA